MSEKVLVGVHAPSFTKVKVLPFVPFKILAIPSASLALLSLDSETRAAEAASSS